MPSRSTYCTSHSISKFALPKGNAFEIINLLNDLFLSKFGKGRSSDAMFYMGKYDCYVAVDGITKQLFIKFHRPYKTMKPSRSKNSNDVVWTSSYLYQLGFKEFIKKYCDDTIKYELERILFETI